MGDSTGLHTIEGSLGTTVKSTGYARERERLEDEIKNKREEIGNVGNSISQHFVNKFIPASNSVTTPVTTATNKPSQSGLMPTTGTGGLISLEELRRKRLEEESKQTNQLQYTAASSFKQQLSASISSSSTTLLPSSLSTTTSTGTKRPATKSLLSFADEDNEDGNNGSSTLPLLRKPSSSLSSSSSSTVKESSSTVPPTDTGVLSTTVLSSSSSSTTVMDSTTMTTTTSSSTLIKRARIGKDPTVVTDFLPDKERDEKEQELRKQLKLEYEALVEKEKLEKIEVVYSYYDGTGHRHQVTIPKGYTIGKFLDMVRIDLSVKFPELAKITGNDLLYIKEDLIIPHNHTFYELISTKARGKSGPLFAFDVREDVRLLHDVRIEKDDSHPGKVVERRWYDRNKHIFPAVRWEIYDPNVKREGPYTIHGGEVNHGRK